MRFKSELDSQFTTLLLLLVVCCLITLLSPLASADYAEFWQQAKAAESQKDTELALKLYEAAWRQSGSAAERLSGLEACHRLLRQQGKTQEAEQLLRDSLHKLDFEAPQYRRLLNILAGTLLWSPRQDEALDLLNQARFFATKSENDKYATLNLSAHIYLARQQYEAVLEVMRPLAENRHLHPGNQYGAAMLVAKAWLKLGYPEKAKEYYADALTAAKKVTYKFDYTEAVNAFKKLETSGLEK